MRRSIISLTTGQADRFSGRLSHPELEAAHLAARLTRLTMIRSRRLKSRYKARVIRRSSANTPHSPQG